jgi:hypothetical protein
MFGLGDKIFKQNECLCCYKQTSDTKPSCIDLITEQDILNSAKKLIIQVQR